MQPIKTTNAMNPAPAKGIQSLPTPVIDDVIITEMVNAWKGDYQKLEYGTKWDDVPHGSQQGSFPEHKLVFQQVSSEDGQWVKRIWANDRVNQDSYNYAVKYSAGSQDHPIYIRTYVVPRETYAPLPDGTPDKLFPNALLVDEEATRIEGELDSKYISVTRVYETIPGPAVPTRRYNERGDLETVIVQTVPPNTAPDPDGLLVTGSKVEQVETGKGVKTTSTVQDHSLLQIKEKKEGLLGETITTDDIVDPSTQPDQLSQTIVSSVVEQFSATKARKRTTTASGPTSLSQKNKDGKLLGDVTSIQSVVEPNAAPDSVSQTILSSEVRQVDSGKAIKTNVVLNTTPILSGNQSSEGLLGIKTTTQSIVSAGTAADAPSLTIVSSEVEPIDSVRSRKVTVSSNGPLSLSGGQKKEGLLGEVAVSESIVPVGTQPDALSQTVISSSVDPIDSAKSKKTTIVSTGPTILSGNRINDRGEIETIKQSIVSANSLPDADSVNTISSEVDPIDVAKSKKTTITVNERATLFGGKSSSGLLGRTSIKDTIVSYPASPDELTWDGNGGIVESTVDPISKTKVKKTTITSSGPTKLNSNTLIESQLGLVSANVEKSIVEKDFNSTSETYDGLNVVKDSINILDNVKSEREFVKVNKWPENVGVDYDEQLGIGIYYTETIVSPNDIKSPNNWKDLSNADYKPIDQWKNIRKKIDIEKVSQALLAQYYRISIAVPIKLPDKLKEITAYLANSYGAGEDFNITQGANTGSYNISNSGSSKSSWSIGGDVSFIVEDGFDGIVDGFKHIFFMKIEDGSVSSASILNTLNNFAQFGSEGLPQIPSESFIQFNQTYKKWPYIKTRTENIVLITGSRSKSDSVSESQSAGINGFARSEGKGSSFDVNVSANSITVPKTLHPAITIKQTEVNSVNDEKGVRKPSVEIRPRILKATSPDIFPVGNYLISADVELYKWGFVKVTAITAEITTEHI